MPSSYPVPSCAVPVSAGMMIAVPLELVGRGIVVPLGRGPGQSRRILTALALYHPGAFRAAPDTHARGWRSLRELHIELG